MLLSNKSTIEIDKVTKILSKMFSIIQQSKQVMLNAHRDGFRDTTQIMLGNRPAMP